MKALQLVRPRQFDRVDIPAPQLPPDAHDRILLRTQWVSLCGSDIPFFTGNKRSWSYPLRPGAPIHECIGEVVESDSQLFPRGCRAIAIPDGTEGLAEYFLAQVSRAAILDGHIEDPPAACVIQPLSTVMNAMERLGDISGKSFVIVGLGSIGLLFSWLARRGGARAVTGIDPCEDRCRASEAFGTTRTLCARSVEVVHEVRRSPTQWDPPDICIEAVGHQMQTLNDCLDLVRKSGTVVAFGVPDHPVYALEYEVFFRKNAILMATVTPHWTEYLPKARDLYLANREALSRLVTHRLSIAETGEAFGMYERQEDGVLKVALDAGCW